MARSGYTVVDVDAHYLEPVDDLTDFMQDPWKTIIESSGSSAFIPKNVGDRSMGGRIVRDALPSYFASKVIGAGRMGPEDVKTIHRRIGLSASIMVANWVLGLAETSQREAGIAYYNAYIDYMLERVTDPDRGIYTMPILSWQEPQESAALLERVGDHPAVVGACFSTSSANPPLGDEIYNPVYEVAERKGLPVVFHGATGGTLRSRGSYAEGVQRMIEAHLLGFSITNLIQITSVMLRGVPERFPGLKFVFMESGLFWVPMAMYRMDEYFLKRRSEAPLLKALPSEYIRDRFYFGTQPLESPKNPKHLQAVMEMIGYDNILFASDYPHFDYDEPSAISGLPFLTSEQKRAILGENAIRVFDLAAPAQPAWLRADEDPELAAQVDAGVLREE